MAAIKLIDCSTAHILPSTAEWLDNIVRNDKALTHETQCSAPYGVEVFPTAAGWIVPAMSALESDAVPDDLREALDYLVDVEEAEWVWLDPDGEEYNDLPVYYEEWDALNYAG